MRIRRLRIENFRAIENVTIDTESTMIVIAGPNGCGKSCILDSIRFVKSTYGGYDPNEWDQWLGEFQINRQQDPWEMRKLLRNKERIAEIEIVIALHNSERQYLLDKAEQVAEEAALIELQPGMDYRNWRQRIRVIGDQARGFVQQVEARRAQLVEELLSELRKGEHSGLVAIHQNGQVRIQRNLVLESIWKIYDPQIVGLIDYHGSHRHYDREQIGGVNLNLRTQEEQQKQSVLYNYGNKYTNIKTQMATEFVLQTLREHGGNNNTENRESLSETLRELFRKFFPGKEFEGIKTNEKGDLEFAVTVGDGKKHDINDLSSGEKEILFGYLRLRNSTQRQGIILLDEPELHLNPKLIQGLPQFYQKYIGEALDNQIWTVTHSDAFLREAIRSVDTSVFHMKEVSFQDSNQNQVHQILKETEGEEAILEMIGDIAGYRPGGKIVIFEGENSDFDKRMTSRLFPIYERKMNFISGGGKSTVLRLHQALESQEGGPGKGRIFSIVDNDGEDDPDQDKKGRFAWDVYHIENYLLEEAVIFDVLKISTIQETGFSGKEEVVQALRAIAEEQMEELVEHAAREHVHRAVNRAIRLRGGSKKKDPGQRVSGMLKKSIDRLTELANEGLSENELRRIADEQRTSLRDALEQEQWKKRFRGRDILKVFTHRYTKNVRYEAMRDMIVNTMADKGIRPIGMVRILEQIDKAQD